MYDDYIFEIEIIFLKNIKNYFINHKLKNLFIIQETKVNHHHFHKLKNLIQNKEILSLN